MLNIKLYCKKIFIQYLSIDANFINISLEMKHIIQNI